MQKMLTPLKFFPNSLTSLPYDLLRQQKLLNFEKIYRTPPLGRMSISAYGMAYCLPLFLY
jgi:hypothetical protein